MHKAMSAQATKLAKAFAVAAGRGEAPEPATWSYGALDPRPPEMPDASVRVSGVAVIGVGLTLLSRCSMNFLLRDGDWWKSWHVLVRCG